MHRLVLFEQDYCTCKTRHLLCRAAKHICRSYWVRSGPQNSPLPSSLFHAPHKQISLATECLVGVRPSLPHRGGNVAFWKKIVFCNMICIFGHKHDHNDYTDVSAGEKGLLGSLEKHHCFSLHWCALTEVHFPLFFPLILLPSMPNLIVLIFVRNNFIESLIFGCSFYNNQFRIFLFWWIIHNIQSESWLGVG